MVIKFSTSFATIVINQKYKNNYVNGLKVVSIFPLIGKGEHQQEEDLQPRAGGQNTRGKSH